MERVLIVAKTRRGPDKLCVGGLNLRTNKNVRLLQRGQQYHPLDTPFEVGQLWNIVYCAAPHFQPPHVEDVILKQREYLTSTTCMRTTLLQHIQPWKGGLTQLFNGCLQGEGEKAFISRNAAIPQCSTGYWLTTLPLMRISIMGRIYYSVISVVRQGHNFYRHTFHIPYVGLAEAPAELCIGTLIRVSLARWWRREEYQEERCYLQISGWYL